MNHNFFFKKSDKNKLLYYKTKLKKFDNECENDKALNLNQKLKLGTYIYQAIMYCDTGKHVIYEKRRWKLDKNLLASKEQLKTYRKFFSLTNNLIKEIHSDPILSLKCKRALCSYLGCVHCHIRGKLNRKID